jgi:2-polyprenyl-3-methyl-5-hydroxy-6-metoxy-1,4-benzoquinol methylase
MSLKQERVSESEKDEREFFARYYGEQRYHPLGWRLRLERDLRVLRQAVDGRSLGRTLSIGCGDGAFELLLAPYAESVLGVDLSPEAIDSAENARAAQGVTNASFRCTSFRELPWDERFDTIVCLAFLHHVPECDLPGFLRDCYAHLEPGGIFFSQDPNARGALRALGRVLLRDRYDRYHTPDERELDPAELSASLRVAGFTSVDLRYVDLTLIPACYLLARGPAWPLRLAASADRLWCASPLARWSSGFAAFARRSV